MHLCKEYVTCILNCCTGNTKKNFYILLFSLDVEEAIQELKDKFESGFTVSGERMKLFKFMTTKTLYRLYISIDYVDVLGMVVRNNSYFAKQYI